MDVGRHIGGLLDIFKVIFTVNYSITDHPNSKKKLLFVFRNFDEINHRFEKLCSTVTEQVKQIWNKVQEEAA